MKITFRKALLKISTGKCVCAQMCSPCGTHYLVAENLPIGDPGDVGKVTVCDITFNDNEKKIRGVTTLQHYMAFCFEVKKKVIFPVVTDGEEVKFKELYTEDNFTNDTLEKYLTSYLNETFLFQWGEAGSTDWQSLKSVAKPSMYLFVEDENKMDRVTIKAAGMTCFKIEAKEGSSVKASNWSQRKLNMTTPYYKVSWLNQDSNQGPSCRAATVLPNKPKRCPKRKCKRMKTFVKN